MLIPITTPRFSLPLHKTFLPDRWLDRDNKSKYVDNRVQKSLTPFGKGTRQCVGTNLAYAELYHTLPLQQHLRLVDSASSSSSLIYSEVFNPFPRQHLKEIRLLVNEVKFDYSDLEYIHLVLAIFTDIRAPAPL